MNTILVNRRFNFQPAAITFPTTSEEISEIVRVAAKYDKPVTARSGGVGANNIF